MNILLGEISSYKAIVIASYLKKHYPNVKIIGYDYHMVVRRLHTKYINSYYQVHYDNDNDNYIQLLCNIVDKEEIDYFFPVHSSLIGAILHNKNLFGNTLDYCGDFETYTKLHHKEVLLDLANKIGIRVPKNYAKIEDAVFPFVGKPADKSSSIGVYYFNSKEDIKKHSSHLTDDYLFQEFIEGLGCGYSVYASKGKIISGYGHKRIAEKPISGGSSIIRAPFYIEKMKEYAEKILKETGWSGFAMFEFKYTCNGELVLIEVNPRIWGSINQGLQNGTNYFEGIIGKEKRWTDFSKEIITHVAPMSFISSINYLVRGDTKPLRTLLFYKTRSDVSLFRDPKGFLSLLARKF